MKDERFKNAGETVWVWECDEKSDLAKRTLIKENKDGSCICIIEGEEEGFNFDTLRWSHYSFTDPNKKEYEPYGAGEIPQLDWVVDKMEDIRHLVTSYDPNGDYQLFFGDGWHSNRFVFEHYTDTNGNPIGKEK